MKRLAALAVSLLTALSAPGPGAWAAAFRAGAKPVSAAAGTGAGAAASRVAAVVPATPLAPASPPSAAPSVRPGGISLPAPAVPSRQDGAEMEARSGIAIEPAVTAGPNAENGGAAGVSNASGKPRAGERASKRRVAAGSAGKKRSFLPAWTTADGLGPLFDGTDDSERSPVGRLRGIGPDAAPVPASWGISRPRFEGLPLPELSGSVDLKDYRPPRSVRVLRPAYRALAWTLLGAAVAAAAAGFGILPTAAALGALGLEEAVKASRAGDSGAGGFSTVMYGEEKRAYRGYLDGLLDALGRRLGLSSGELPSIRVIGMGEALYAGTNGPGLSGAAGLTFAEGYARLPSEQTAAVMAHELGHLAMGDAGGGRILRDRAGLRAALYAARKAFGLSGLLYALTLTGAPWAWTMLLGPVVAFAALPLVLGAALAGIAASRQEEYRADHFAAWLTDPAWMAAALRSLEADQKRRDAGKPKGFWAAWLYDHPPLADRIRRLEAEGK